MKKIFLLLAVATIGFLGACSKKEDPTPTNTINTVPAPTKKELLSKTWKISEAYENGQASSNPALASQRWTLNTNATYQVVQSSGNISGVWEFNSDESKILFDKGTQDATTFDILELTDNKWKTKYQYGTNIIEIIFIPS